MSKSKEKYDELTDIMPFEIPSEIEPYVVDLAEVCFKEGKKSGARSFAKLVKQMMDTQKRYFDTRNKDVLAESKKIEERVRRAVEVVLNA